MRPKRSIRLTAAGNRAQNLSYKEAVSAWRFLSERMIEFRDIDRPVFEDLLWCIRDATISARNEKQRNVLAAELLAYERRG